MKETNLTVNYSCPPLKDVWYATAKIYVNDQLIDGSFWEYFVDWDEAMYIREAMLEIIWSFKDEKLELNEDLNLEYYNNGELATIPDVIANADFEFGYKANSKVLRLIGDKIPIRLASCPGSNMFKDIESVHLMYEPEY
jgi:hypothetical protein